MNDGSGLRLADFDPTEFLAKYWQRKPCVLRQALPDFEPPIAGDDLAGLACDELAEARLVSGTFTAGNWQVQHGPFDESTYASLPERDWTLLVQDVEKHYPPLNALLAAFDFIPDWRRDDLMISFAVPGGSVGPHVDQYDVFLLQAEGRRHWDIARRYEPALTPGLELKVLSSFTPERSFVLEPGDILYLPPGVAHHGVALDHCLTYSIGFRAPSAADLSLALGEWLASGATEGGRYRDPPLKARHQPGEVDADALAALRELLLTRLEKGADLDEFLGAFLSRYRLAHEAAAPARRITHKQLEQAFTRGLNLTRHPFTRLNWLRRGRQAWLFAGGRKHVVTLAMARELCATGASIPTVTLPRDADSMAVLLELLNEGHLLLEKRR